MATSPSAFLRFLADNAGLMLAVFERREVDEAELLALIARHRNEAQPGSEHVRRQLEELGVVERSAHADAVLELAQPVVNLLEWLTHQQRLSSATVLRAYLDELSDVGQELANAVRAGDASAAALALRELHGSVERVRALSQANRESTVTEAQTLRSASTGLSAVERFLAVRRLWDRHLQPLRHLVSVQGEMNERLDRLQALLAEGEQRFLAHGAVARSCSHTIARITRMRREAAANHLVAVVEIAPLYGRLRRESGWVIGASRALARVRAEGVAALELDRRMGLVGWRTRYLMSDEKLRARLAGLVGYVPMDPPPLADPPPPPDVPLITRDELREALRASVPVSDVLGLILANWPDRALAAQLRAFGHVASGAFGAIVVDTGPGARTYDVSAGTIEAWPLVLREVIR